MRKIALIALLSLPLFAHFFPPAIHTSVQSIEEKTIQLKEPFALNGMSGVVIHHYNNHLSAISSRVVQTSMNGDAKLIPSDIIHHDKLPTINTSVQKGDSVIGGYLYNNVLILAPDVTTYTNVTKTYHKRWIHPDIYALYLSKEGETRVTKENLFDFSKKYQVGLIYIIRKNSAILFDPISKKIIATQTISNTPPKGKFPFYMHFDKLKSGWLSKEVTGNYYKEMDTL
jgi:hypothetical protein